MNVTIPDALHICPGCKALCEGAEYCAGCRERMRSIGDFHAARAAGLYSKLPRETGKMPEEPYPKNAEFFFRLSVRLAKAVAAAAAAFGIGWLLVH